MRAPGLAILASAMLGAAAPPPAAPVPPAQMPPKTVAPVTVTPGTEPPKLDGSFPAGGQVLAPGVLVLRLSFDQKMLETGFDVTAPPGGRLPACLKTPRLLNDGKTFVLLCTTAPDASYAVAINADAQGGFANIGGRRAPPATIAFSTNKDDGPRTLAEALKAAGLADVDVPIEVAPATAQGSATGR